MVNGFGCAVARTSRPSTCPVKENRVMKNNLLLAGVIVFLPLLCGCRVGKLGKSVAKNQVNSAEGVLYTDSLFTDDGRSKLAGPDP